jgi:hypothetical protein
MQKIRGVEWQGFVAVVVQKPVTNTLGIRVTEKRNVIARHEPGFGILHKDVGRLRQMRPDIKFHIGEKNAKKGEFNDQVSNSGGNKEKQDVQGKSANPLAWRSAFFHIGVFGKQR